MHLAVLEVLVSALICGCVDRDVDLPIAARVLAMVNRNTAIIYLHHPSRRQAPGAFRAMIAVLREYWPRPTTSQS